MNVISVAEGETGRERKRGGGEMDRRVGKGERVGGGEGGTGIGTLGTRTGC